MILTKAQEAGLRIALERYRSNEPYTVIAGYAGVGKSTLIKFIVSALDFAPEEVAYVTFTGKASEVLREKGNPNAMTAHKLLYHSKQLPSGKFIYRPRPYIDFNLVIVDEVSMLPRDMWQLLLSHRVHVIACGDPFQIPPIDENQDNHVLDNPHIFLDEIMRQAKESDIIRLSMDIREGRKIVPREGKDAQVFDKSQLVDGMYYWADQILVATNRTRYDINSYIRERDGRVVDPEIGDKVICLRNCWNTMSQEKHDPLINGTIGWIEDMCRVDRKYILNGHEISVPILQATIATKNDKYVDLPIDYTALTTGKKYLNPKQEYAIRRNKENPELPIEFNYGYAITGHRAQGSQWGKILTIEENFPTNPIEHSRWLYTCVTRAADKLTLVLKK